MDGQKYEKERDIDLLRQRSTISINESADWNTKCVECT
ncbi:unnamed protein product [Brassica oleracea var. botrytis]|uniref:Uncharacterized protein n=2 Tax=Brassica TaxID=3705 RepID=A0A3P6ASB9_BRAOL|nr:unnamed protein product [Brassica napus]VDC94267.1 unnamed protein product [Brassica oleracea]